MSKSATTDQVIRDQAFMAVNRMNQSMKTLKESSLAFENIKDMLIGSHVTLGPEAPSYMKGYGSFLILEIGEVFNTGLYWELSILEDNYYRPGFCTLDADQLLYVLLSIDIPEAALGTKENPFVMDSKVYRGMKYCKCARCKTIAECVPWNDFFYD